ncbi:MAG: phage portal protein [Methanolobus sp.]|nr:phage portal protein [Methanolobus sp.]
MGFFSKLFGNSKKITKTNFMNLFTPFFASFGDDITTSNAVTESINSITKHASKLKMAHYRLNDKNKLIQGRNTLNYILQYRPNPVENGSDFLEKAMYHWLVSNNVFIYLHFIPSNVFEGKEVLDSLWIIDPSNTNVTIKENQEIYLTFAINNETQMITTSVENVAVIKRMVGKDEFFGSSNDNIKKVLNIINMNYQGIENAIKSSAFIRFIVESVTVLSDDKKKKKALEFNEDFLNAAKNGGVIFTDATSKITPITNTPKYSDGSEMDRFYESVYNYFGTNKKIISGNFTDVEWNSFFESTLEVFINKLEIELTKKLFTQNEVAYGNKIIIQVDKIQSMSITSRLNIIKEVKEVGMLTINEMRELVYLPPVEDGDIREVSLNYVNSQKQDEYQTGNPSVEEVEN